MNGYKGKVYFCKHVGGPLDGFVACYHNRSGCGNFEPPTDSVVLGSCDVDVEFADTRQAEVEALEKEMSRKDAEHQHWLNVMNGKIQSLLAIEHEVPQ